MAKPRSDDPGKSSRNIDSRRDRLTLQAMNPSDRTLTFEVLISQTQLLARTRIGAGHVKEAAYIVPQILENPTAIFEGLRRDEDEDRKGVGWRCYCGIPDRAFTSDGETTRPSTGRVYLVFLNDERVVYNWYWDRSARDDRTLPTGHRNRFIERLL